MKVIGIIMSGIGALILGYFGVIGIDTGIDGFRVTNLASLFIGSSLLISGSILVSVGELIEKLIFLNEKPRQVVTIQPKSISIPMSAKETTIQSPRKPKKPQTEGDEVFIETYKGTSIHQRYNGHYIGEKWFAGIKQARAFIDSNES